MTHFDVKKRNIAIAKSVRDGSTVKETAEQFCISEQRVYAACKENGVVPSTNPRNVPSQTLDVIAALQEGTLTEADIAREHGITRIRVNQIKLRAIERGIKIPKGDGK
jgi:transposase-like protein